MARFTLFRPSLKNRFRWSSLGFVVGLSRRLHLTAGGIVRPFLEGAKKKTFSTEGFSSTAMLICFVSEDFRIATHGPVNLRPTSCEQRAMVERMGR